MKIINILFLLLLSIQLSAQVCTPWGGLEWNNPSGFNPSEDRILIFAKKTSRANPVYIDIGVPTKDPTTYGSGDTALWLLDGPLLTAKQYENDPLAMLVYNDTGEYVALSAPNPDTVYYFAVFNTDDGVYSNPRYLVADMLAVYPVTKVVAFNGRVQWDRDFCFDSILVVVNTASISGSPSGDISGYTSGVNTSYSASTSYFNGSDGTDGKVLYTDWGDRFIISGLTHVIYYVKVWVYLNGCWSTGVEQTLDNRIID